MLFLLVSGDGAIYRCYHDASPKDVACDEQEPQAEESTSPGMQIRESASVSVIGLGSAQLEGDTALGRPEWRKPLFQAISLPVGHGM